MFVRAFRTSSIVAATVALGASSTGCSAAGDGEVVADSEQAIELSSPSPNGGVIAGPGQSPWICAADRIVFEGKCRKAAYFEKFTTAGATLLAIQGSKSLLGAGDAIAVLEMPNAHTTRVRLISTKKTNLYAMGARYSNGYEVLSETTTTFLSTPGAFKEFITTVAAREGGSFKTVWYERVAQGGIGDRKYTWSSDLCHDVYGEPMYAEGEMCGPLTAIPTSGDGDVSDECKSFGKFAGGAAQAGCAVGLAYAGALFGVGVAGAIVVTGGTASPVVAGLAGAVIGFTGATIGGVCNGAKSMGEGLGELACDAVTGAPESSPPALGIELETSASLNGDEAGCAEMGGSMYYGAVNVTTSGNCDDVESDSSNGVLELFSAADEASEEIVVYGDPACEPSTTTMTPSGGICIIVSG